MACSAVSVRGSVKTCNHQPAIAPRPARGFHPFPAGTVAPAQATAFITTPAQAFTFTRSNQADKPELS